MSNGVICTGPYIPEIDAGYNVQVNGVSVNFLRDPFCFGHTAPSESGRGQVDRQSTHFLDPRGVVMLEPITQTKLVQVPKFLYRERVRSETEVVERRVHVPYSGPLYRIKQVKVPVFREKVTYVPKQMEVEKVYEIPKLEIRDRVQEDLCYIHKFKISHKMVNCIVEKVTPVIPRRFLEKLIRIPSISGEMLPSMSAGASLNWSKSCISGEKESSRSSRSSRSYILNESNGSSRPSRSYILNESNGSSCSHDLSSSNIQQRGHAMKEHSHTRPNATMMNPESNSIISNAMDDGDRLSQLTMNEKGSDEKFLYSQSLNDITSISSMLPSELLNVRADLLGSKNLSQLISSMDSFTSHDTNTRQS